jgi:hypothetical protein
MLLLSYLHEGQLMPKSEIFFISPDLQQVLDSVPEHNDPRSRLGPFKPYILRWRRQGKTYRRIAEILTKECKVSVSHIAVLKFVKRAARPRKPQPDLEFEPETIQPVALLPLTKVAATPRNSDQSGDPYAEARERMRRHKDAAAVQKSEPLFPIYTDDELLEPHVLNPTEKKEN